MFVVDIAPAGAPRKQVKRRGFKTKSGANHALVELLGDVNDGTYVARTDTTVADFAAEWLPAIRTTVEASTWDSYERNLTNHVTPRVGKVKLQQLEPTTLNKLYAELLENGRRGKKGGGLSPRTVRYVHTIVHRMLRDAVRWGRVARNVAGLADPPSAKSARAPEMRYWSPDELHTFLDHVADERLYPAFRLAAMTGMRRGEVFGVLWSDVDLDSGKVSVRRQTRVIRGHLENVEITKSSAGRRTIDLDGGTVTALRAWRRKQLEYRLAAGGGYKDGGFVFTVPDGSPVDPESAAKVFERRVAKSDLPRIRFHDLRHSHAVHLIAAGQHVKVVSERLGHASTAFTMDRYGHVMPHLQSDAAAAVAALVDG
jgi:integrase